MREISINKPGKNTLIMYTVAFGSCDEAPKYYGIAHMIEHLLFKGSKNYKKGVLEGFVEHSGGILNAFTHQELTAYWCLINSNLALEADTMLRDMVERPLIPTHEINKERDVIIQEYKMYRSDPDDQVQNLFKEAIFPKTSGLSHPIIGTLNTIKNIDPKTIRAYYKRFYNPGNITRIVVGNVETSIDPYTSDFLRKVDSTKVPKDISKGQAGIQQTHMLLGNRIESIDIFTAGLIEAIMNDMTGRLFQKIREEKHLVYGIHFGIDFLFKDSGAWSVKAAMDGKNINYARDMIIKELVRVPTNKELDIAVQKCIGKATIELDRSLTIGEIVSFSPLHNVKIEDILFNYEKKYKEARDMVVETMKNMNFNNNIMVGVFPGK